MLKIKKSSGSVLVFSLIIMAITLVGALSVASVTVIERKTTRSTSKSVQAFQVADSAMDLAFSKMNRMGGAETLADLGDEMGAAPFLPSGDFCSGGYVKGSIGGRDYTISFQVNNDTQTGFKNAECDTAIRDFLLIKVTGESSETIRSIEAPVDLLCVRLDSLPQSDYVSAFYRLDEKYGTWDFNTAKDDSDNLLDGEFHGSPESVSGFCGSAIKFNENSDDYIQIPNDGNLDFNKYYTISLWIQPTVLDSSTQIIMLKGDDPAPQTRNYGLTITDVAGGAELAVSNGLRNAPGVIGVRRTENLDLDSTWYHVVIVNGPSKDLDADGSVDDDLCIYINSFAASWCLVEDQRGRYYDATASNNGSLFIGGHTGSGTFIPFEGAVDEVIIWSEPLVTDTVGPSGLNEVEELFELYQ